MLALTGLVCLVTTLRQTSAHSCPVGSETFCMVKFWPNQNPSYRESRDTYWGYRPFITMEAANQIMSCATMQCQLSIKTFTTGE